MKGYGDRPSATRPSAAVRIASGAPVSAANSSQRRWATASRISCSRRARTFSRWRPDSDEVPDQALDLRRGLGQALVVQGRGGEDRRLRLVLRTGADVEQEAEGVEEDVRPREVGLVDQDQVRRLDDPGLERLDHVPGPRLKDEDDEVGGGHHVELGLADADRLDEDPVHAEGVEDVGRMGGGRRKAAVAVARGERADEEARLAEDVLHPDAVAEEGPAREGARGIDGQNPDAAALVHGLVGQGRSDRALADARRAGDADPDRALPAGDEAVPDFGDEGGLVLDFGDQAGAGQAAPREEFVPEFLAERWTFASI